VAVAAGAAPPPATEVPSGEEAEYEENEFDGFADPAEALSPKELQAQLREERRLKRNFLKREERRIARIKREVAKHAEKEAADPAPGSKRRAATDAPEPGASPSKSPPCSTLSRPTSKRQRPFDFAVTSCSCAWPCRNPAHRG